MSSNDDNKNDSNNNDDTASDMLDVVIIGAGWAGISAARHLLFREPPSDDYQKKNKKNNEKENYQKTQQELRLMILEGREDIGGRCRTVPLYDDDDTGSVVMFELGPQWIHDGGKNNPVYQIALESGVAIAKSSFYSGVVYEGHNTTNTKTGTTTTSYRLVPENEVDQKAIQLMEKGFLPYCRKRQDVDPDIPLRQCVDDFLAKAKIKASSSSSSWIHFLLDGQITQEYAASLEDLSTHWWDSSDELHRGGGEGENDFLVMGNGGYKAILDHYAQPIQQYIQCHSKVRCIDWSQPDKIVIQYRYNNTQWKLVTAKRVLITVPLGVLKANAIQFLPELPDSKRTIISKMGVGLLNKCLLVWDEADIPHLPFWPLTEEWLSRIVPPHDDDDDQQGLWTEFYNPCRLTGAKRPMLCAFTPGRIAARIEESLSEEEIIRQVLHALQAIYAPHNNNSSAGGVVIPDPSQVIITKWGQDEFAMGSYSYNAFGAKHRYRDRLADPVEDRLFFAGEACSSKCPSTTHGAFLSGAKAAQQIIQSIT